MMSRKGTKLFVLLCLCLLHAATALELPPLHSDWEVTIQNTDVLNDRTFTLVEYSDYTGNRVRIDSVDMNSDDPPPMSVFYTPSDNTTYTVHTRSGVCTSTPFMSHNHLYNASTRHLIDSKTLLTQGINWASRYNATVRGISCTCYVGYQVYKDPTVEYEEKKQFCFAVDSWLFFPRHSSVRYSDGIVPVRMTRQGNVTVISPSSNTTRFFHIIEDFVNFKLGRPHPSAFDFPDGVFCPALPSAQQPFPAVPRSFSVRVEANIREKNYTVEMHEFVDAVNERVRFDTHRHNSSESDVWDARSGAHYQWTHALTSCFVELKALPKRQSSLSDLFDQRHLHNYTYSGHPQHVRGITTHAWKTSVPVRHFVPGHGGIQYHLHWHFTRAGEWQTRSFDQYGEHTAVATPVRLVMAGAMLNISGAATHTFEHYYEFFDFVPGAPNARHFAPPRHLICANRIPGGDLGHHPKRPLLPPSFSSSLTSTDVLRNRSHDMAEYYDLTNDRLKLVRADHTVIEIVASKSRFDIRGGQCTTSNVTVGRNNWRLTPSLDHLQRVSHLWHEDQNMTWRGDDFSVRGIACSAWDAHVEASHGAATFSYQLRWYFAAPQWEFEHSHDHTHQVPVRVEFVGTRTHVGGAPLPFHHFLDWTWWDPHVPADSVFVPPANVFCPALVSVPFPIAIPDNYDVEREHTQTLPSQQTWFDRRVHSYTQNMMRLETSAADRVVEVYDVAKGVVYVETNGQTCEVKRATPGEYTPIDESSHHLSHQSWLAFKDAPSSAFPSTVRSITANTWASNVTIGDGLHSNETFSFAVSDWPFMGAGTTGKPVPLLFESRGVFNYHGVPTKFQRSVQWLKVRQGPIDPRLFNVPSTCHGQGNATCSFAASVCEKLGRQPCVHTDNVCGPCLAGLTTGDKTRDAQDSMARCDDPNRPSPSLAADGSVTQGTAAGIAVTLFFVGLFGGWVLFRCMGKRTLSRQGQRLDKIMQMRRFSDEDSEMPRLELPHTSLEDEDEPDDEGMHTIPVND